MTPEDQVKYRNANGLEPFGKQLSVTESLAALVLKAKQLGKLWYILPLVGALGILYGIYQTKTGETLYESKIAFVVNEDGESKSSLFGMIGGLGLGGSSMKSPSKIMAIARSNVITHNLLRDSIQADNSELLPILGVIREEYADRFEELDSTLLDVNDAELASNMYLQRATDLMLNANDPDRLVNFDTEVESGLMEIQVVSTDEALSFGLSQTYFRRLADYYITRAVGPQRETVLKLRATVDSLERQILSKETSIARLADTRRATINNTDNVRYRTLERQKRIQEAGLAKITENLAMAEFNLQNVTPYFQIIQQPYLPLRVIRESLVKNVITGAILGGILGVLIIIVIVFIRSLSVAASGQKNFV